MNNSIVFTICITILDPSLLGDLDGRPSFPTYGTTTALTTPLDPDLILFHLHLVYVLPRASLVITHDPDLFQWEKN